MVKDVIKLKDASTFESTPDSCWQSELSNAQISLDDLLSRLNIKKEHFDQFYDFSNFPIRATESYLKKIRTGDPSDPLLRQIIPHVDEKAELPGFINDPLNEEAFNPVPGVIHKYYGRLLLIVTGACAIHCRYCFRRHFPYKQNLLTGEAQNRALDYIENQKNIREIILSGGDPLAANNNYLFQLTQKLSLIKHIHTLRIHTRLPVVLPDRIDNGLMKWIEQWIQSSENHQLVFVIHVNHPNEIDSSVKTAIEKLKKFDILLLNQSVLLKGVNDNENILIELSERLFNIGVKPYYLHTLDPVKNTAHFMVESQRAKALHKAIRAKLPGYLTPSLVREIAGEPAKTIIQ